jgi:hypothetical protein
MKKTLILFAALFFSAAVLPAENKSIAAHRLPDAVINFLDAYFPDEQIIYASREDELIYPDYDVLLTNGISLEFYNNGTIAKVACDDGISNEFVPVPIIEFVKKMYPGAYFIEYELESRHYAVKLSNHIELKFDKHFNIVKIDD